MSRLVFHVCRFSGVLSVVLACVSAGNAEPMAEMGPMSDMPGMSHEMGDHDFGGLPASREASGTSWQPDATVMEGHHMMLGDWATMLHYNVFAGYDHQSGARGDDQFNSVNWLMLMASKESATDQLMLRGMFSLEPLTVTKKGYPLLFQSGEAYHGAPLVDRQHPHDFFMELAARYRHVLQPGTLLSVYVAPSGEPALGPTAFPHRESAMDNPAAPISHHWLDSTHISFGVVTLGIAQKKWQLEGSWFNGREPDENRWNFDPIRLNSYAGRLSWNPSEQWSGQISAGYLKSPEQLHPDENVHRYTASITHTRTLNGRGRLSSTFGWGLNHTPGQNSAALLAEASWTRDKLTVFGRAEYVQKTGEELNLAPDHAEWDVTQVSLGASRAILYTHLYAMSLGTSVSYSFQPSELRARYGDHPMGFWIFLRLHPAGMVMKH